MLNKFPLLPVSFMHQYFPHVPLRHAFAWKFSWSVCVPTFLNFVFLPNDQQKTTGDTSHEAWGLGFETQQLQESKYKTSGLLQRVGTASWWSPWIETEKMRGKHNREKRNGYKAKYGREREANETQIRILNDIWSSRGTKNRDGGIMERDAV